MAPLREIETKHSITGLEKREINGRVCLRTRVSLNVRMICVEELLCSVDCELLDLIDKLAATVVALSRKPFGVLVGERSAHCFEHSFGNEVLARDELDTVTLAIDFATNHR